MRSKNSPYISFDFSEPYKTRWYEIHGKTMRGSYHSTMEVRLVAFVRVREKRELGDAENIPLDILHALLPHRARRWVIEHAYLKAV